MSEQYIGLITDRDTGDIRASVIVRSDKDKSVFSHEFNAAFNSVSDEDKDNDGSCGIDTALDILRTQGYDIQWNEYICRGVCLDGGLEKKQLSGKLRT